MRFKKGMRVEMCSNEEGYLGAWFEGVIVGRQTYRGGHRYRIRYRHFVADDGQPLVEDFSSAKLRPIPPNDRTLTGSWSLGDAVEAYDMDCWWRGIIIKVLPAKFFLVYFPDTRTQKAYHTFGLRPGYEWLRGRWSLPSQEGSQSNGEGNSLVVAEGGETSLASSHEAQSQSHGEAMDRDSITMPTSAFETNTSSKDLEMTSDTFGEQREFRSESRLPLEGQEFSNYLNATQAVEESGRCKSPKGGKASERADSTLWGRNLLLSHAKATEKVCAHEDRKEGIDKGAQDANRNQVKRFKFSEQAQTIDHISTGMLKTIHNSIEICPESIILGGSKIDEFPISTIGSCTSLAFVSCDQKDNMETEKERTKDDTKTQKDSYFDLATELSTHKMELLAYHTVLQAFHANGPLSWERESLLTNLRIELHVTCEEHTLELEKLVSQL